MKTLATVLCLNFFGLNLSGQSGGNVFAGGAGMSYKKFSAELRWYEKKDLLRLYPFLESDLSKVALVLGWKLW